MLATAATAVLVVGQGQLVAEHAQHVREVAGHDLQALVQAQPHPLEKAQQIDEERKLLIRPLAPRGSKTAEHPFRRHEANDERDRKDDNDGALCMARAPQNIGEKWKKERKK